jgi:hypothetical protein
MYLKEMLTPIKTLFFALNGFQILLKLIEETFILCIKIQLESIINSQLLVKMDKFYFGILDSEIKIPERTLNCKLASFGRLTMVSNYIDLREEV